jgi:sec-independent protein translocase protein TatB
MFDIGIGEILILGVVGLLVFGPERLPRAAADAAKWLKQIRSMASGARQDLADSAGLDLSDTVDTVKSLQEFHPRRLAASILKDEADDEEPKAVEKAPAPRPAFDPDAT